MVILNGTCTSENSKSDVLVYLKVFSNTVKIRHSALSLSGFINFFWWAYLRVWAYPRRIYSYFLWAYLTKLTFLGGLSAGEPICWRALSRIFTVISYVLATKIKLFGVLKHFSSLFKTSIKTTKVHYGITAMGASPLQGSKSIPAPPSY